MGERREHRSFLGRWLSDVFENSTFIGILSSADSTILDVDFGAETRVGAMSLLEVTQLFTELRVYASPIQARMDFFRTACIPPDVQAPDVYYVQRVKGKVSGASEGKMGSPEGPVIDNFHIVLSNKIRLARLFKKGDLRMPMSVEFLSENGTKRPIMVVSHTIPIRFDVYHLDPGESEKLNEFLRGTSLPFSPSYLDVGFTAFETSYGPAGVGLQSISLFAGLEAMLNPGGQEVQYTLARNIGCLLARDVDEYREICRRVKRLYGKRSAFVHRGEQKEISQDDLVELREILRRCILKTIPMKLEKKALIQLLDEKGFAPGSAVS